MSILFALILQYLLSFNLEINCYILKPGIYDVSNGTIPEQIHVSLGKIVTEMIVTWNTKLPTNITIGRYGIKTFERTVLGNMTEFKNGENHIQYVHSIVMNNLTPNTTYIYQVGDGNSDGMSQILSFKTLSDSVNWSPRFCIYGDLGYLNPQSFNSIKADADKNMYDVILHVGDFAYDMDSNFGEMGDKFMNMIQPIASKVPYMTTPGNHENAQNFSNYKNRFRMPNNDNENMFYSYNVGPVHIISISTEFYFYIYYGVLQIFNQYEWLINDLKTANLPQNRAKQPWIILLGHRPIYCTNNDSSDCTYSAEWLRYGVPGLHLLGLEDLLYQYGVDMAIWAHEHTYERMFPVFREQVVNSSTPGKPYTDPLAPVHVVSGSAGCQEKHDTFPRMEKPYSAFHSTDYGYSRMNVFNQTHLYFEQVSDDKKGAIIDWFWLIKSKHGPYI